MNRRHFLKGLGAAIAAVVQPVSRKAGKEAELETPASDLGAAVRSAALFVMLLELQGHDERRITRVLDAVLLDDDREALSTAVGVSRWLDDLRHRFDLALAKEVQA